MRFFSCKLIKIDMRASFLVFTFSSSILHAWYHRQPCWCCCWLGMGYITLENMIESPCVFWKMLSVFPKVYVKVDGAVDDHQAIWYGYYDIYPAMLVRFLLCHVRICIISSSSCLISIFFIKGHQASKSFGQRFIALKENK